MISKKKTEQIRTSRETDDVDTKQQTKHEDKKEVCRYYVMRRCKHGAKGKDCSYDHPKKCFRFLRNGTSNRGGCNKGKACEFFHPPLCRASIKSRRCSKEDCRLHHLKGTKIGTILDTEEGDGEKEGPRIKQKKLASINQDQRQTSAAIAPKVRILQRPNFADVVAPNRDRAYEAPCSSEHHTANGGQNFMEANHQIQQMIQVQIEKMLKMNLAKLTGMTTCRCQATCH